MSDVARFFLASMAATIHGIVQTKLGVAGSRCQDAESIGREGATLEKVALAGNITACRKKLVLFYCNRLHSPCFVRRILERRDGLCQEHQRKDFVSVVKLERSVRANTTIPVTAHAPLLRDVSESCFVRSPSVRCVVLSFVQ